MQLLGADEWSHAVEFEEEEEEEEDDDDEEEEEEEEEEENEDGQGLSLGYGDANADREPSQARPFSKGRVVGFPRRRVRHALVPLCTDSGELHKDFVVPRSAVRAQSHMAHTFCIVEIYLRTQGRVLASRARTATSSREVPTLVT